MGLGRYDAWNTNLSKCCIIWMSNHLLTRLTIKHQIDSTCSNVLYSFLCGERVTHYRIPPGSLCLELTTLFFWTISWVRCPCWLVGESCTSYAMGLISWRVRDKKERWPDERELFDSLTLSTFSGGAIGLVKKPTLTQFDHTFKHHGWTRKQALPNL